MGSRASVVLNVAVHTGRNVGLVEHCLTWRHRAPEGMTGRAHGAVVTARAVAEAIVVGLNTVPACIRRAVPGHFQIHIALVVETVARTIGGEVCVVLFCRDALPRVRRPATGVLCGDTAACWRGSLNGRHRREGRSHTNGRSVERAGHRKGDHDGRSAGGAGTRRRGACPRARLTPLVPAIPSTTTAARATDPGEGIAYMTLRAPVGAASVGKNSACDAASDFSAGRIECRIVRVQQVIVRVVGCVTGGRGSAWHTTAYQVACRTRVTPSTPRCGGRGRQCGRARRACHADCA